MCTQLVEFGDKIYLGFRLNESGRRVNAAVGVCCAVGVRGEGRRPVNLNRFYVLAYMYTKYNEDFFHSDPCSLLVPLL